MKGIKPPILKEIKLVPTQFYVDVWIGENQRAVCEAFNKRYGGDINYYETELDPNQVGTIIATQSSELKGERRIVMNIVKRNPDVVVHESVHVFHHIAQICGLSIGHESQEWQAYYVEYLFREIMDKTGFEPYKL